MAVTLLLGISIVERYRHYKQENIRIYGQIIWPRVEVYEDVYGKTKIGDADAGQTVEIIGYQIGKLEVLVQWPNTNMHGYIEADYVFFTNNLRCLKDASIHYGN